MIIIIKIKKLKKKKKKKNDQTINFCSNFCSNFVQILCFPRLYKFMSIVPFFLSTLFFFFF